MDESQIEESLLRYLLGESDATEKTEVEAWLAADESHIAQYKQLQRTHLRFQWGMQASSIEPDYVRFRQKLNKNGKRLRSFYRMIAAAAVILLTTGIGLRLAFTGKNENTPPPPIASVISPGKPYAILHTAAGETIRVEKLSLQMTETDGTRIIIDPEKGMAYHPAQTEEEVALYNRLEVPRGGEFEVQLADGTRVWLNAESELRYPTRFSGNLREVYLQGEAYFDVSHQEAPFVVHCYQTAIRVLGTEFNVNARISGAPETVLVEGVVSISREGTEVLLKPNDRATINQNTGEFVVEQVEVLPYIAWKDGHFVFVDESLETIMDKLSRWYDLEVEYQTEALRSIRLSGNLERYHDVNQLFVSFERISEARFRVEENRVIVENQ